MSKQAKETQKEYEFRIVDDWLSDEALVLLEGWARDGYTYEDIANRIGISVNGLGRWRKNYPEINSALKNGREIVDYKVENALLKAALGYVTKETRVLMTLDRRTGIMQTVEKETITKEAPPSVRACEVWLYNRLPDKWKQNRQKHFEIDEEDTTITISVVKADTGKVQTSTQSTQRQSEDIDEEWVSEVNTSVEVKRNSDYYGANKNDNHELDRDYWPDDWDEGDYED